MIDMLNWTSGDLSSSLSSATDSLGDLCLSYPVCKMGRVIQTLAQWGSVLCCSHRHINNNNNTTVNNL